MDEGLMASLAAAGSAALLDAMATDAWQTLRSRVTRMFSRSGIPADESEKLLAQATVEAEVGAASLEGATADLRKVREDLSGLFIELLRQNPAAAQDLRSLIADSRRAASESRSVDNRATSFTINSFGSGSTNVSQSGSINHYYSDPQGED